MQIMRLLPKKAAAFFLAALLLWQFPVSLSISAAAEKSYIKWVDFSITAPVLQDALEADLAANREGTPVSWIDLLAALGQKYGGDFAKYQKEDLAMYTAAIKAGEIDAHIRNKKLYNYYKEAYGAVLGGFVGRYTEERTEADGSVTFEEKYGLKVFHPLAAGYSFTHSDDFGNARTYGYKRRHLGHDMFCAVGTPVAAIESGYVEALGWNQYGGWRIGIRSFDGKRYYYYAHLRKDHPYTDLYEGKLIHAGEIIGYTGMTGYSAKENVNNIQTPHLHVGLEIIFDPTQKDGYNQIWISLYELTVFLANERVRTYREGGEAVSHIKIIDAEMPD